MSDEANVRLLVERLAMAQVSVSLRGALTAWLNAEVGFRRGYGERKLARRPDIARDDAWSKLTLDDMVAIDEADEALGVALSAALEGADDETELINAVLLSTRLRSVWIPDVTV